MVIKINNITVLDEDDKLNEIIDESKCYMIYFTATWCGPCKLISPNLEKIAGNYKTEFLKIDIDICEEITHLFNINSVPSFIFFKSNKEFYKKIEGSRLNEIMKVLSELEKLSVVDEIKTEDVSENAIEDTIENKNIYYNNIDNLENYGKLDSIFNEGHIDNNLISANSLEPIDTDIDIKKEDDLNKFFNTPLNSNEIDNLEDFYKLNVCDIGEIN